MISNEHTPLICHLVGVAGTDMAVRSTITAGEALELILKDGGDKQGVYAYLTLWTLVYTIAGSVAMNLEGAPEDELDNLNKHFPRFLEEACLAAIRDVSQRGLALNAEGFGELKDMLHGAGISLSPTQGPLKPKRKRWWNIW